MKITNVEGLYLRLPEVRVRTDSSQDALIVRITTDAGVTGWGEVDASPWVARAVIDAPPSHTLASGLRHLLVGEDPLDIDRLWGRMYEGTLYYGREGAAIQAMAGVDLALWDLAGRRSGQGLADLLGRRRDTLTAYDSGVNLHLDEDALADQVNGWLASGFDAVKIKVGRPDLAEDLDRRRALEFAQVEFDVLCETRQVRNAQHRRLAVEATGEREHVGVVGVEELDVTATEYAVARRLRAPGCDTDFLPEYTVQ